jgi:hypothetical protein
MAALTNPIEEGNLASRFADYVAAAANDSIAWGTNAYPAYGFTQERVVPADQFGGSTSGRASAPGSALTAGTSKITASVITNLFRNETQAYLGIRKLQAILNVTGTGGNTGTRPTAGIVYDVTAKAYLVDAYQLDLGAITGNPTAGTAVDSSNLETFFSNLQARYVAVRDTTVIYQTDVCHASCHSSCHSSRGRR